MPGIHLIATPSTEESLAKAVGRTHFLYTQYVNRMHGRSGHLWQNRFFSCPLDEEHMYQAMAYVERNPVKARMHRKAWLYPWSSAAVHCGMVGGVCDGGDGTSKRVRRKAGTDGQERGGRRVRRKAGTGTPPEAGGQSPFSSPVSFVDLTEWAVEPEQWKQKLMEADAQRDERIRLRTQTGRPLGSDSFVGKLEAALGRRLRPLPVGRPRKTKSKK